MTKQNASSHTPLLRMEGIVKIFPGVRANDGIDLEVRPGEVLALLGENGAGKTTLMRVLVGLYDMDQGRVFWNDEPVHVNSPAKAGELGIGMVHQQFSLIPTFTVAQSVALGSRSSRGFNVDLDRISESVQKIADEYGFNLDPDAQISDLSMGARQRVEIIKILYRNAQLLILDEPSSVLTPQEVQDLFRVIRKLVSEGKSVVFISHKLDEVMDLADRITVLRDGKVVGNLSSDEATPRKLSRLMVGREVLFSLEKHDISKGTQVLEVNRLSATRDGVKLLDDVSFHISAGEIVGIAGVAGNGQEELVQVISGLKDASAGSVSIDRTDVTNASPQVIKQNGLSYMPSDRRGTGLVLQMNLRENVILRDFGSRRFSRFGFIKHDAVHEFSNELVRQYDIRVAGESVKVGTLSGGNQQKVVAARELSRQPKVLIAEQPTMGLDVGATEYVRSRLLGERDRGTAVLLISTELSEVLELSDRVLVMFRGEVMGEVNPSEVSVQDVGLMMAGQRLEMISQDE